MSELKSYAVWYAGTRWFHWVNAVCVIALGAVGLTILNTGKLGVSNPGKVTLKTVHVSIGYIFALNLFWRIVWAFMGNHYARWHSILPGGKGYFHSVRSYISSFIAGNPEPYLGHNPLGQLGIAVLFVLIFILGITGLVIAGTDLFYPPSDIGSRSGLRRRM